MEMAPCRFLIVCEIFIRVQNQEQSMKKRVKGLHLYSAFIQSAVQFMPLIHPFTHQWRLAAMQGTNQERQEQLGVRRLAQRHFDTPRVGSNRQPSDCQTTALTS